MHFTCEHCTFEFDAETTHTGFVRCPECEQPTATGGHPPAQEVTCERCDTHYAIPQDRFAQGSLGVTCKKCGNKFEVAKAGDSNLESELNSLSSGEEPLDLESEDMAEVEDLYTHEDLDGGLEEDTDQEPTFDLNEDPTGPGFSLESTLPEEPDLDFDEEDLPVEDELSEKERGMFLVGSGLEESAPVLPTRKKKKQKSKAPFRAFWAFLILVSIGVAGLVLRDYPELVGPEERALLPVLFQPQQNIQLTLNEPLKGKWIKNHQVGPIFLLSGTLTSYYPKGTILGQIQISGRLFDGEDHVVAQAQNLAGHLLPENRISQFNQAKLEAFSAVDLLSVPEGSAIQLIPFQVIFTNVDGKVQKLEARIKGFVVGDQPVQVR